MAARYERARRGAREKPEKACAAHVFRDATALMALPRLCLSSGWLREDA